MVSQNTLDENAHFPVSNFQALLLCPNEQSPEAIQWLSHVCMYMFVCVCVPVCLSCLFLCNG